MSNVINLQGFQFRSTTMNTVRENAWTETQVPTADTLSVFDKAVENHRLERSPDNGNHYFDTLELLAATRACQKAAVKLKDEDGPLRAFFAGPRWSQGEIIMSAHAAPSEMRDSIKSTPIRRDQLPKDASRAITKIEMQPYLHGTLYGMGPAEPDTPENRWSFKFDSAHVVEVDGVVVGYRIELIQTMTATGEVPPYAEGGQVAVDARGRYLDQDTPGYPM